MQPIFERKWLGEFAELFANDIHGDDNNELDFYECRFNLSFKTLRIDIARREMSRSKREVCLSDLSNNDKTQALENYYMIRQLATQNAILPEDSSNLRELLNAIDALPPNERKAVVLCHIMGYKEESDDPDKKTAATLCGVTGTYYSLSSLTSRCDAFKIQGGKLAMASKTTMQLRDIFYELSMAKPIPDSDVLDDFIRRYPEHATVLTDFAIELALDGLSDKAEKVLNPDENINTVNHSVSKAISRFQNRLYTVQHAQIDEQKRTLENITIRQSICRIESF